MLAVVAFSSDLIWSDGFDAIRFASLQMTRLSQFGDQKEAIVLFKLTGGVQAATGVPRKKGEPHVLRPVTIAANWRCEMRLSVSR